MKNGIQWNAPKVGAALLYILGAIALIATVVFVLKYEEPVGYAPQFGTMEPLR